MHWFVELRDFLSSSQCVWRELFGPCPIETCFLADMFFRGEGGLQHPHVDNLLGVFCVPTRSFKHRSHIVHSIHFSDSPEFVAVLKRNFRSKQISKMSRSPLRFKV